MVRDDISIDPQELDQFEEGVITDADMELYFGIPMPLNEEIPPKVSDGIAALLVEYMIKPGLKDGLSCKLKELYPYLLLLDEELQHRYSLEKDGDIDHWKQLDKEIQQLLAKTYLCKFLNINIAAAEEKLAGVQQFLTEHKEKGRAGQNKILYPILGEIWTLLVKSGYDREHQIAFVYKFCVLAEFRNFGKRHLRIDRPPPDEIAKCIAEEKDVVEKWYDPAKPFISLSRRESVSDPKPPSTSP